MLKSYQDHIYIHSLIKNCEKALASNPLQEISIQSPIELEKISPIRNAIYIIKEVNGDKEKTFEAFKEFRTVGVRACARLNQPSDVLYVGSSTTGLKNRLMQHLEEGPVRTYALHMKHWFKGKYQVEILEYDEPIEVLQLIEDSISFNLKPAFGKKGGNNK